MAAVLALIMLSVFQTDKSLYQLKFNFRQKKIMKTQNNRQKEIVAQVSLIKDLSLFEYAVALSLVFAFAVTLML